MTVGGGFRRLTRILRHIERGGWRIDGVAAANGDLLSSGGELRIKLTCSRSADGNAVDDDCPMALTDALADFDSCRVDLQRFDERHHDGMKATLIVSVQLPDSAADTDENDATEDRKRRPLHRDRDRLAQLYRGYDTFSEMADQIPEDVSPETIRRYTIEHDLHTPGKGDRMTNGLGNGVEEDRPIAGATLVSGVDPEDVISAVENARTLYDVQRALELDRDESVALLRRLDLLDLVVGRLDRDVDPEQRRTTIRRRLKETEGGGPAVAAGRNG